MKHLILCATFLAFSTQVLAQQGFSTIEERMTGKEFDASGLSKLSDDELAELNEWLRSHSVATLDTPDQTVSDARGFENDPRGGYDDSTVVSRIDGPFSGWDGETVFRLENGMVWKQVDKGRFYVSEVDSPSVQIEKGLFDSWKLQIEGYNKELRVERIQ